MSEVPEDFHEHQKRDVCQVLNRMERTYLAVLRTGALVVATILLIYASWLGISGLYQISRDADSVKEAPATVATDEITAIDLKQAQAEKKDDTADPMKKERAFYRGFAKQYFALYRSKFEPSLQKDDPKTSERDFDARFIHLNDRLDAVKDGNLNFETDKADLETLLKGMTDASDAEVTKSRLAQYKTAKKSRISRTVTDTRTERYCSYYGYYIDQCITWDTRSVPVKRTVNETKLPDGVIAPGDLFHAYHEKYVTTLVARRTENAAAAQKARAEIVEDNAKGSERLWTAVRVIGSFVVVMFLFLLIALERHQRRLARARD